MKTILHIFRNYSRDSSLFNNIVRSAAGDYRNVVCYLSGEDEPGLTAGVAAAHK